MEIDGGRKKILEGEEEVTTEGLLASCGVDVPKPRLSRPGRQRNTASSLPPGSLLCSGWARLSGVSESRSWLGLSQLTWQEWGKTAIFLTA